MPSCCTDSLSTNAVAPQVATHQRLAASWRAAMHRVGIVVAFVLVLVTTVVATKFSQGTDSTVLVSDPGDGSKYEGIEKFCTAEYKQKAFEESWNNAGRPWPLLMSKEAWCPGDNLWGCHKDAVDLFVEQLRARPGSESFYETVPCDLYKMIAGRTLWIVGDSMANNWYRTIRCFLSDFWLPGRRIDVPLGEDDPQLQQTMLDLVFAPADIPERARVESLPACTQLTGGARVCRVRMNIMQQFVDKLLPNLELLGVTPDDLMVFNTGIWQRTEGAWTKGYVEFDEYRDNFDLQVREFAAYYVENKEKLPEMVWKDTVAQHKYAANPQWPFVCQPYDVALDSNGHLYGNDKDMITGGWRNRITEPVMKELGLPYVETWNQTLVLQYLHSKLGGGSFDCSHYCGPGPRGYWTWRLIETLKATGTTYQPIFPVAKDTARLLVAAEDPAEQIPFAEDRTEPLVVAPAEVSIMAQQRGKEEVAKVMQNTP